MWRMLTGRAQDLEVTLAEHDADAERGSAHWLADYTFRPAAMCTTTSGRSSASRTG